jgi:hypothetical protein
MVCNTLGLPILEDPLVDRMFESNRVSLGPMIDIVQAYGS